MATIKKQPNGNWQAHVFLSQDPGTRKQRLRIKTFASEEEANAWAADVEL